MAAGDNTAFYELVERLLAGQDVIHVSYRTEENYSTGFRTVRLEFVTRVPLPDYIDTSARPVEERPERLIEGER